MARRSRRIVASVRPARLAPNRVEQEFRARLAAGARLRPRGAAQRKPLGLLSAGYTPKHKVELFDTTCYLTNPRQNEDLRFFVGYVVQEEPGAPAREIHPRIFYKDISLIWRSASHYIRSADENWIGKGDLRVFVENGEERESSDESSTDLPL